MCLLFLKIDMAVETDVIVFSVSSHTQNAQLWVFDDPEHLPTADGSNRGFRQWVAKTEI